MPADFGFLVNGYQDDFAGTALAAAWRARGPATNVYRVANGLLSVTNAAGDPNHLLYELAGYNRTNQEVLARIRVNRFGTGDQPRAGIGVGVDTNSAGMNYHFRNEGTLGVHTEFLDDLRSWGPELGFKWETNKWYWMRLKQQPNTAAGQPDAFAKVWLADGTAPEPADWQSTWDRYPAASVRAGFAGITAGSAAGVAMFDVDYILIKAEGLSSILAGGSEINVLGRSGRGNTVQLQTTLRNADARTVVLGDEIQGQGFLSIHRIDSDSVVLEMAAVPGRAYKLQASNDLNTWTEIGSATGSPSGRVTFLDSEAGALEQRFYRVVTP